MANNISETYNTILLDTYLPPHVPDIQSENLLPVQYFQNIDRSNQFSRHLRTKIS